MQTISEFLEFKDPFVNDVTFRRCKLQGIRNLETLIHVAVLSMDNVKRQLENVYKTFLQFFILRIDDIILL